MILEQLSIISVCLYRPSRPRGQDPWLPATVQSGWTSVLVWSEGCGRRCVVQSPMPLLRYMQQLFTDVKRGFAALWFDPNKEGRWADRPVGVPLLSVCLRRPQRGCLLTPNPFALENLRSSFWFRAILLYTLGSARHFRQVCRIQMADSLERPLQALHETTYKYEN